jgi:transposase
MEPSKFPDAARTGDAAIIAPNTQPSVVQQGWVRKEGHFFKTWKRRWLVIFDDMRMMYFTGI